jgi:S1-C subfamily serine protease
VRGGGLAGAGRSSGDLAAMLAGLGETLPPVPAVGSPIEVLDDAETVDMANCLKGVVQVFLQAVRPSFTQPWTKSMPEGATGTGFVVDLSLRLLVTNAHCVEFGRTILVRKSNDHFQYEARLLAISHQVDIAILTVEDDQFWLNTDAITMGDMCRMQHTVSVVGFPIGGETVSITRGVVSRIDWIPYSQAGGEGNLCVQVDAAINPGNSGGPALTNGKLAGIAFQGMGADEASNVGYIIPVTILKRVLDDFKHAAAEKGVRPPTGSAVVHWPKAKGAGEPLIKVRPFGRFAVQVQEAESPYLRAAVKLPHNRTGVIVRKVSRVSNLYDILKNGDVITAIDGVAIGNEGRVIVPPLQPLDYQYIISSKLVGEPVTFTVCRDGNIIDLQSTVENPPMRVPLIHKEASISYIMFAGFVFSPLSEDSELGDNEIEEFIVRQQAELLMASKGKQFNKAGQQVVILTSVLPHRVSIGYDRLGTFSPVYKVDGKDIDNMEDLAKAIATAQGPLISFEFCNGNFLVMPLKEGLEATDEIQDDYGMTAPVSKDIAASLKALGLNLGKKTKVRRASGGESDLEV